MMIKKLRLFLLAIAFPAFALMFAAYFRVLNPTPQMSSLARKDVEATCSGGKDCKLCKDGKSCDQCAKCKNVCSVSMR
ncbi:MAG: hypothetical protein QM802_24310 [Agriterribacter sp.]